MEGQIQYSVLRNASCCREASARCDAVSRRDVAPVLVPRAGPCTHHPRADKFEQRGTGDEQGHKTQRNQLWSHPETVLYLTFKMLQTQTGGGKAAQQAALLPPLREESEGEGAGAGQGAGRARAPGSSRKGQLQFPYANQSSEFGAALGRKATARGVPCPPGLGEAPLCCRDGSSPAASLDSCALTLEGISQ